MLTKISIIALVVVILAVLIFFTTSYETFATRLFFVGAITLLICGIIYIDNYEYIGEKPKTVEVKLDKITMRSKSSSKKDKSNEIYYLYSFVKDNGEVITCKNEDASYIGKYNSGDYEAILKEGRRYKLTYIGKRNHFMSNYPNIVDLQEIKW